MDDGAFPATRMTRSVARAQEVEYSWQLVRYIDGNLTYATELQGDLNATRESIYGKLDDIEVEVDTARAELDYQEQSLIDLVDFVFDESFGYMRCGWIGAAYKSVVEDSICGDIVDNLSACSSSIVAGAAMIYLSIMASLSFFQRVELESALPVTADVAPSSVAMAEQPYAKNDGVERSYY
ncbi:hypothetical protein CYMTET_48068 [Cymbomonas tetramitiformis]|uniref:Uncharacterized protein n=1 Tax=Cymbomonas tetramitiformis TaxID=36881 RepID=A0AAE0EVI3_9CHLO|nr:hypothetical protein CYMTET_48068 [Cymbomonas tetramitiformis]